MYVVYCLNKTRLLIEEILKGCISVTNFKEMCKPIYDNLGGKFCVSQGRLSKLCGNKCKLMHLE